jgi:hypothetical protein
MHSSRLHFFQTDFGPGFSMFGPGNQPFDCDGLRRLRGLTNMDGFYFERETNLTGAA